MACYNPQPPRVWSRVQGQCTYINPDSNYENLYVPLTNQTITQNEANNIIQMFYKGNILQYKGNSANFSKSQKYSQLATGTGPSRKKVFATQSQIYTNPNTTGLLRVNYETFSFPNEIVGAPNNISSNIVYNIPNPNKCSTTSIEIGGNLVCGTYANPCSGEIYKKSPAVTNTCFPAAASNVPGPEYLCWNNKIKTFYPRQTRTNNNSSNKWPINYKGFVSAIKK
jgi:hypothetical protein